MIGVAGTKQVNEAEIPLSLESGMSPVPRGGRQR